MSALIVVVIVVVVVLVLLFVGGLVAVDARRRRDAPYYDRNLAEADRALEQARAADRGWDRALLDAAVADALGTSHPGVEFERVDLVFVEDLPGVTEDRAHFDAAWPEGVVRVVLNRDEGGWRGETVR